VDNPLLNNDDEFPVELRFAKKTGAVDHRFLCNEATRDCTTRLVNTTVTVNNTAVHTLTAVGNTSTTVYLQHLEFSSPINVVDDTTVPFEGKVTVAGTESALNSGLFCSIINAKVCLKDHAARNKVEILEGVCVQTDQFGRYSLPAVLGTKVSPYVDYNNHTFRALNPAHDVLFDTGIEIKANVGYTGYNLEDITSTNLTVEVSGFLSNIHTLFSTARMTSFNNVTHLTLSTISPTFR
jgi:hypothetical protein